MLMHRRTQMKLLSRGHRLALAVVLSVLSACASPAATDSGDVRAGDAGVDVSVDATPDQSAPDVDAFSPDVATDVPTIDATPDNVTAPDGSDDASLDSGDVSADDAIDAATDRGPMCLSPEIICAGRCVDPRTDSTNCGACGALCPASQMCVVSVCRLPCATPRTICGTGASMTCVDLQTDTTNCGVCGIACPPSQACVAGACRLPCAAPRSVCGAGASMTCVDLQTDPTNCGACATACPVGQLCTSGACRIPCAAPRSVCGTGVSMTCVDLQTDNGNCGTCSSACPAGQMCIAGACRISCAAPRSICGLGAAMTCVDLQTDIANCGSCGVTCTAPPNATATCGGGSCGSTCNAGFMRVGGACVPVVAVGAPRPIAPLSTATVTSRRPLLRWILAAGSDGARVELCSDRACTSVIETIDATGSTAMPAADLPPGVVFWRLRGMLGGSAGTSTSPTWQFIVGFRSAPVNTSWGTTLDVNGDGFADVVVGAYGVSSNTGRAYVYLGRAGGLGPSPATTLIGPGGAGGYFGNSVASAGDVNGDGFADVVVGAHRVSGDSGAAYVYFAGVGGLAPAPATVLVGRDGPGGQFGVSVASAGDVNGDGYSDIIIGSWGASSAIGAAHVYLGSATGPAATPASSYAGADGINGRFGCSVSSVGDLNGDGYADVVIGAMGAMGSAGRAYVYSGSASGLAASPSRALTAPLGGHFGYSVASANDVDGDGYADLVVGAPDADRNTGRANIYRGSAAGLGMTPDTELVGPDAIGGSFGTSVAGAADVSGDGYADLVVGAPAALTGNGRAHFYMGSATGVGVTPVASMTGTDGIGTNYGAAVAGGGDINGDGFGELVIGVPGVAIRTGRVHMLYGRAGGLDTGRPPVVLTGPDGGNGYFGLSVASADGFDGGESLFRSLGARPRAPMSGRRGPRRGWAAFGRSDPALEFTFGG